MQPTGSQTGLKIISIIDIIGGIFFALTAVMLLAGGAVLGSDPSIAANATANTGMETSTIVGLAVILSFMLIISAIITIITGILGLRAAKDNQKIKPVWILAIIGLIFAVISFISSVIGGLNGSNIGSTLAGLIMPAVTFWLANNVKKEAGL